MKVRWTKGSIRLRITPTELDSLLSGLPISETLRVPGVPISIWSISIIPGAMETQLCTHKNHIRIFLSEMDQTALASPLEEGIYFNTEEAGESLRYYIEKDFPCLHPRASEALETPTETFDRTSGVQSTVCPSTLPA